MVHTCETAFVNFLLIYMYNTASSYLTHLPHIERERVLFNASSAGCVHMAAGAAEVLVHLWAQHLRGGSRYDMGLIGPFCLRYVNNQNSFRPTTTPITLPVRRQNLYSHDPKVS